MREWLKELELEGSQILNGSQVAFQEQEPAVHTNSPFSIIPGINLGATPQGRYVYNGLA